MDSFLIVLVFAPVLLGLLWMYMSPLRRLDGYTPVKVIIRIALFVAVFGGFLAQLNFLAHHEPLNTRRLYGIALLVIEAIPMLFIVFYRYYQDPNSYGSKRVNRTESYKR
jgi:RsiW-degrading membrane proteinase PrsW (M82 family)